MGCRNCKREVNLNPDTKEKKLEISRAENFSERENNRNEPLPICEEHYCVARSVEYLLATFPEILPTVSGEQRVFTDDVASWYNLLDRAIACVEWDSTFASGMRSIWNGQYYVSTYIYGIQNVRNDCLQECTPGRRPLGQGEWEIIPAWPCYHIFYENNILINGSLNITLGRKCQAYSQYVPNWNVCEFDVAKPATGYSNFFFTANCRFIQPPSGICICCTVPGLSCGYTPGSNIPIL